MKKTFMAVASATAIAAFVLAPATAEARNGAIAAGVIGGIAAGAIIAGAANGGYYGYGPGPAYYGAYGGPAPGCFIRRERVWDGYGWRMQRVRVCY